MRKDRGFAWIVMIASSVAHMLSIGFSIPLQGTLVTEQLQTFNVSLTESSWVGATHVGILFMFSPISSLFVKLTSPRLVQITGSVCTAVGLACCFFTSKLWHVYLAFGVLSGIGVSLCYMSSSEILAHHFQKYMYLASAVVMLGYFIGFSITPVISQYLFDEFGFKTAMIIMSAAQICSLAAGTLYITPEKPSTMITNDRVIPQREGAIKALDGTEPTVADEAKMDEMVEAVDESGTEDHQSLTVVQTLKRLTCNVTAWSFVICGFFFSTGTIGFIALIVDYANKQIVMTKQEAALGVTILGIAAIPGSILVCAKSKIKYDRVLLHSASIFTFGICAVASAFCTDKISYYITMAVFGLANGAQLANLLAVAYDICGPHQMAVLFGLELLFEGIGGLTGPPLCSYAGEVMGPMIGIIMTGIFTIIAALVLLPIIVLRCRSRTQQPTDSTDSSTTTTL